MACYTTPLQNDLDAFGLKIVRAEKELDAMNMELVKSRHARFEGNQRYAESTGGNLLVMAEARANMQKWHDITVVYRNALMDYIDDMRSVYQWKCTEVGREFFRQCYGEGSEDKIS